MLEDFLGNLEMVSDDELMAEWNQAAEDSKNDWMLDPDCSLL